MNLTKVHDTIPAKDFYKLLFAFAVVLQLSVITFSHFNGYYDVSDTYDFLTRFLRGTVLSMIALVVVAYPDLLIIRKLEQRYPMSAYPVRRILNQFILTVLVAVSAAVVMTLFSDILGGYEEELASVLLINAMIFSGCNILLMVIFEAWIYFIESTKSKQITRDLEKELSQIRFEVLKRQINPHFLFNSLNVLSGLVAKDSEKAQKFIDEFSHIYRYVLETIEQPLVRLGEEIIFARSYMKLQQIRYGNNLLFEVSIPSDSLEKYLPPLSLQSVLENVIKHNIISAEQPLQVTIESENDSVVITNNIQLKLTKGERIGLGQKNLIRRYAMVGDRSPDFQMLTEHYRVTLPLITGE